MNPFLSKRERKDEHVSDTIWENGNAIYIHSIAFLNFTQRKKGPEVRAFGRI